MAIQYDWNVDEAPVVREAVGKSIQSVSGRVGQGCLRKARKYHKPRANRKRRRAFRELLHTGSEPRNLSQQFTSWDID